MSALSFGSDSGSCRPDLAFSQCYLAKILPTLLKRKHFHPLELLNPHLQQTLHSDFVTWQQFLPEQGLTMAKRQGSKTASSLLTHVHLLTSP